MKDERRKDSVRVEYLADGMYQTGTTSANIPEYNFFGENAKLLRITENHLAETVDEIYSAAKDFVPTYAGKSLVSISGPNELIYIDNKEYFAYTEEYVEFPVTLAVPENRKKNKKTQVSLTGYTLTGEPIIAGGSKGLIITESYTIKEDLIKDIKQGTVVDSSSSSSSSGSSSNTQTGYTLPTELTKGLITSLSKSNKRYINGDVYYDVTVTTQEI